MKGIRNEYAKFDSIESYYKENSKTYENPHISIIEEHLSTLIRDGKINKEHKILDLCCGTGQVTLFLNKNGINKISGCDPYTYEEYEKRTGIKPYRHTFLDIANGNHSFKEKEFDLIICSFAMHLCEKSILPNLMYNLSSISDELIILSPNNKPEINIFWDCEMEEKKDKVRTKIYKSKR